jgi:hypothetical protein
VPTLLVIDGDEMVYKAGFGSQHTEYYIRTPSGDSQGPFSTKKLAIEWLGDGEAEEVYSLVVPQTETRAAANLNNVLKAIVDDVKPTEWRIFLTGKDNFRIGLATLLPYKGNRSDAAKPVHYQFIRDLISSKYDAITVDGMEADDALSITSWQHRIKDTSWDVVIATQDKDLKMVPGLNYNPSKREKIDISVSEGRLNFYKQMLIGDGTDNIPGIHRLGPATAEKVLRPFENSPSMDLYKAVLSQYAKAGQNPKLIEKMPEGIFKEEGVIEVARLLWMQQEKEQLWVPDEEYYNL